MAAGSSAPELFTSVAGVGTGSDVGVGTIVGWVTFAAEAWSLIFLALNHSKYSKYKSFLN